LDVGCWTDNTGERLIRKKECTVDGVEFNEVAAAQAKTRGYRQIFGGDAE